MNLNASKEDDGILDILAILSVLRRQFRLILVTFAIILGLTVVYIATATPIFTAKTLIYVDPSNKNLLASDGSGTVSSAAENARIESEVKILRSPTVLLETLNQAELISDPSFGPSLGMLDKIKTALGWSEQTLPDAQSLVAAASRKLENATDAKRQGLTYLIEVSARSADANEAARIANVMARAYVDLQVRSKTEAVLASRDVLQNQIDWARTQLEESEVGFDTFIDQNLDRLDPEAKDEQLSQLRKQYTAARDSSLTLRTRIGEVQSALEGQDYQSVSSNLQSVALQSLEAQRQKLLVRLEGIDSSSADVVDLRSGLSEVENQIKAEAQGAIRELQLDLTAKEAQFDQLRNDLRNEVLNSDLSPQVLAEIYSIQQEAEIAQRQYSTLLVRLRDLETQALLQVADSRIVSEAFPPVSPSEPKVKLTLVLGAVVAMGVGLMLALLNEYFVGGVTSVSQLANIVPERNLGAVPKADKTSAQTSVADIIIDDPMSVFAESLRRLRAGIDQSLVDTKGCRVIAVTSAMSGEGKSVTALSLARTYASAGKRVLLIDADLRNPSQWRQIDHDPNHGFLDYLSNPSEFGGDVSDFYVADPKSNTGMILGRGRAGIPTDQLLHSSAFESFIANARESMDIVLIDTSPIVPVVDARYVIPLADAVVMVVRHASTSQSYIREAYTQIADTAGERVRVFTVLNCDEKKLKAYGYYS